MRCIAVVISLSLARAATAGPLEEARDVDQSPTQLLIRTHRGGYGQPPASVPTVPRETPAAKLRERTEAMDSSAALTDVDGAEDPAAILRAIRSQHLVMRACYEDAFRRRPDAAGAIPIRFTIEPAGRVVRFVVETNSVADAKIAGCFTERSRDWRFPRQAKPMSFLYVFRWPSLKEAGSPP
jgi:hypothetical protein